MLKLLDELGVAGNLATDAQIAALAIERDAILHTSDTDFLRFPGLRWFNPNSEIGMGSARLWRVGLGVLAQTFVLTISFTASRKSWWDEVFGGTPKTARRRHALPNIYRPTLEPTSEFGFNPLTGATSSKRHKR